MDSNDVSMSGRRPFVGRTKELSALHNAAKEAFNGTSRVILLAGEPGIGKTRLSQMVGDEAEDGGMNVLWARCYEDEGIPTYWPWINIVRSFLDTRESETTLAKLGNGAADIGAVIGDARLPKRTDAAETEPHQRRFRFFDAMARFIRAAAREKPLLVVVDNLHCADLGSLQLLEFLCQETQTERLMVLGTYRSTEVTSGHPLNVTLGELARHTGYEHVHLSGLARSEIEELYRKSRAQGGAENHEPDEIIDLIMSRTDGNALYVTEVLNVISKQGEPLGEAGADEIRRKLIIPDTLRAAIRSRLYRMPRNVQTVLMLASLLGREVETGTLAAFVAYSAATMSQKQADEFSLAAVGNATQLAATAALLETAAGKPGVVRFCHAMIQSVIVQEAESAISNCRWLAGNFLVHHYGDKHENHAEELHRHFSASTHLEARALARQYALYAARAALEEFAYESAISYLEPVANEIPGIPANDEEAEILSVIGQAYNNALKGDKASMCLGRAFTYYEQTMDITSAVSLATARLLNFINQDPIANWILRAKQLAEPGTDAHAVIEAYGAFARYQQGQDAETTIDALHMAIENARRIGSKKAELAAYI